MSACQIKLKGEDMDAFYKRINREMHDANKAALKDEKSRFIKREMARKHTEDDGCISND